MEKFLPLGTLVLLVLGGVAKALPVLEDQNQVCLEVMSTGYGGGSSFHITKDSVTVLSGIKRGLNVAIFDGADGSLLLTETFDTWASSTRATDFATLIEGLPAGTIVAIAVSDEATHQLHERAKRAIDTLGSDQIRNLGDRGSWAFIGIKGIKPGVAVEAIDNSEASVTVTAAVKIFRQERPGVLVSAKSAGYTVGNYAVFSVNGAPTFTVSDDYNRGLNVIVIDESNGSVLHQQSFDTYGSTTEADDFAALIEHLPSGRAVAIAVRDEATNSITDRAKNAIKSIGGTLFDRVDHRGSYTIIGQKGSDPGKVAEANSNQGPVQAQYYLRFPSANTKQGTCDFHVTSYGYQDGHFADITVEGVSSRNEYSRGITLAVMEKDNCHVCISLTFDTWALPEAADFLADVIEGVSTDRIIIATILDEGTNQLTERAKAALESIGSGQIRNVGDRDAWAIIGRKGAPKGSVPEIHGPEAVSLQASVPLTPSPIQGVITRLYR